MNKEFIDITANIAKIGVDMSKLSVDKKEFIKMSIEFVAEIEKARLVYKDKMWREECRRIEKLAQKHKIDKIVTFPVKVNNQVIWLTKIYGEEVNEFANVAGVVLIDSKIGRNDMIVLEEAEKNFGCTLYEKQNNLGL